MTGTQNEVKFDPYYPECREVKLTWEECNEKYTCDMGEECWLKSREHSKKMKKEPYKENCENCINLNCTYNSENEEYKELEEQMDNTQTRHFVKWFGCLKNPKTKPMLLAKEIEKLEKIIEERENYFHVIYSKLSKEDAPDPLSQWGFTIRKFKEAVEEFNYLPLKRED